jgi:hypothetical protein
MWIDRDAEFLISAAAAGGSTNRAFFGVLFERKSS